MVKKKNIIFGGLISQKIAFIYKNKMEFQATLKSHF